MAETDTIERVTTRKVQVASLPPADSGRGFARLPENLMNAPEVVAAGIAGLEKNRAVVVPGLVNKIGSTSTRFAPRSVVRKIAGAIKY